jgi:hypothetical protein
MTLFCHDRLSRQYKRYFSNKKFEMHAIVSHFHDISLKLQLLEGEVIIDSVHDDEQNPYYVIVSQAILSSTYLRENCHIYLPFQTDEIGI